MFENENMPSPINPNNLLQYLTDIDTQAQQMFDMLVKQMKETEGITEQLKEENQMEWVCCMQNIEARVREKVCKDIIFT